MQRNLTKLMHLFLVATLLLSLFGIVAGSQHVRAVSVNPPSSGTTAPVYPANVYVKDQIDPPTKYTILGQPALSGGKIYTVGSGPTLTTTHRDFDTGSTATGQPADIYKGGQLDVTWKNHIELSNYLDILGMGTYGFAFVAIVNLAPGYTADNVLNAIDWNAGIDSPNGAYVSINGSKIKLQNPNSGKAALRKAGTTKLRFGLGYDDIDSMLGAMIGIISQPGFNAGDIPIEFHITVDVAKLTKDGDYFDSSPNKVLTTGKLLPSFSEKNIMSVDFYDSNNVVQGGRNSFLGTSTANGMYYPKLANGTPISVGTNHADGELKSWRNYISPTDNSGVYNTYTDNTEYVDGKNLNLPGTTQARNVTLAANDGRFSSLPTTRFNRVVDYYTGKNVTSGSTLTHSPAGTDAINTPKTIWYSGTGSDGKQLSPASLTVTDTSEVSQAQLPTITGKSTVTNVRSGETGTNISATPGDLVTEKHTYSLSKIAAGQTITNQQVHVTLPPFVTFQPNSIKLNGKNITGTVTSTGFTTTVTPALAKLNDQVTLEYTFRMHDTFKNSLSTTIGSFTGKVSNTALTSNSNANTINYQAGALRLLEAPKNISFGNNNAIPNGFTTYIGTSSSMKLVVENTIIGINPWHINVALTKDFTDARGKKLTGQLKFKNKLITNTATSAYSDAGVNKGNITLNGAGTDKFNFELAGDSGAEPNTTYNSEITWTLVSGPTQ